jgi:hypothetical protein
MGMRDGDMKKEKRNKDACDDGKVDNNNDINSVNSFYSNISDEEKNRDYDTVPSYEFKR